MKKNIFLLIIIFSVLACVVSCNDPLFFIVHEETPILKPLIQGSPTNFVTLGTKMYVASGKQIWEYNGSSWNIWKKLNDRIIRLAATNTTLYALYLRNDNGQDGRIKNCINYVDLGLSNVQSIYAANNVLFACVGTTGAYTFYCSNDWSKPITTSSNDLKGVAYDNSYYYLCTQSGIFCVDKTSFAYKLKIADGIEFFNIINLDTTAVAITVDGAIYEINNASIIIKNVNNSSAFTDKKRYTTTALAIWNAPSTPTQPTLLLVGRRESYYSTTSGYTYGYVEIGINSSSVTGTGYNEPGLVLPTSVYNYDNYLSSLGKEPVNYIIQAPSTVDSKMTLFASTQQNGVWSYRERDGIPQWNAEQ